MSRLIDSSGLTSYAIPNAKIAVDQSAGANTLTITVQNRDGSPISGGAPLFSAVTWATDPSLDPTIILNAPLTLTLPQGALMGVTSGVPFRLWLVLMRSFATNTPALGIINPYDGTTIYKLNPVIETTSNAVNTGSDSANVIYSNPVGTGCYSPIGYLDWSVGLATAGNWELPSIVTPYRWGTPLPGDVVNQVVQQDATVITGSTAFVYDDNVPTITQGVQVGRPSLLRTSSTNLFDYECLVNIANSGAAPMVLAAFASSSGYDAIAGVGLGYCHGAGLPLQLSVKGRFQLLLSGYSTATTSVEFRANAAGAGTFTINGAAAARKFGGAMTTYMRLAEIMR